MGSCFYCVKPYYWETHGIFVRTVVGCWHQKGHPTSHNSVFASDRLRQRTFQWTGGNSVKHGCLCVTVFYSAMSLIEMSQQHRTTPARATFDLDFNPNNDANSSTADKYSSELAGSGIPFTPTRRYSAPQWTVIRPVPYGCCVFRPSVRHTCVLCHNGKTYMYQTDFGRQKYVSRIFWRNAMCLSNKVITLISSDFLNLDDFRLIRQLSYRSICVVSSADETN